MAPRDRDLLDPLMDLPGVADAADAARTALAKAHRHRTNIRNWPVTAAEAAVRGARCSSALDGGGLQLHGEAAGSEDPVLAGALRVGQALEGGATNLVGVWQRAPLQALARLHALAAADLVADADLGRPRSSPEVVARLDLVTRLVTGGSAVPAAVLAGVAHGELMALAAFGSADGVVARGVSRLVTISSGLDPHGLGVPEVYWMRRTEEYRSAVQAFATGEPDGVAAWIRVCCRAFEDGAREAISIADAAAT